MDVKFIVKAECRADNINVKRTSSEITKMIELLFDEWCGIKAVVEVSGLIYIGDEQEDE